MIDAIDLTKELIRRPSVTPADAGAMDIVEAALAGLGFACRRMKFGDIENLYARHGSASPNLCFAGHTDVVPVGDQAAWSQGAFDAAVVDGVLIGRGAILHHDWPQKAKANPDFRPVSLPVTRAHLETEGLGPTFVNYMSTWAGFVEG